MKGGNGQTAKVYKLGETATVFANGMPMFSIKYVTRNAPGINALFTFSNINLPNCALDTLVAGQLKSSTSTSSGSINIQSNTINRASINITLAEFSGSTGLDQVYFYSPTSRLTYAIFEL